MHFRWCVKVSWRVWKRVDRKLYFFLCAPHFSSLSCQRQSCVFLQFFTAEYVWGVPLGPCGSSIYHLTDLLYSTSSSSSKIFFGITGENKKGKKQDKPGFTHLNVHIKKKMQPDKKDLQKMLLFFSKYIYLTLQFKLRQLGISFFSKKNITQEKVYHLSRIFFWSSHLHSDNHVVPTRLTQRQRPFRCGLVPFVMIIIFFLTKTIFLRNKMLLRKKIWQDIRVNMKYLRITTLNSQTAGVHP